MDNNLLQEEQDHSKPINENPADDLDCIIEMCCFLKGTDNSIKHIFEITSLGVRFNQILEAYDELATSIDMLESGRINDSIDHLSAIDRSLCPEAYFFEGLANQLKGNSLEALENYSKILSMEELLSANLVALTIEQIKRLRPDRFAEHNHNYVEA